MMRSSIRRFAALVLGVSVAASAQAQLSVRPSSRDAASQWLETSFPSLFPRGAGQDGVAAPYTYRFYPSVGNAFAFSGGRFFVASLAQTGGQIVDLTDGICQLNAALCEAAPVNPSASGAASECFNPVLLQAGTTYQWDWQSSDGAVQFSSQGRINGTASFAGRTGVIETERTVMVGGAGAPAFTSRVLDYETVENTPQGPVLLRYGSIVRMDLPVAGSKTTTVNAPVNRMREFSLALNESYAQAFAAQSTMEIPGLPSQTSSTSESNTITYRGQESITVPAGTYVACKFDVLSAAGRLAVVWHARGSGLPLVITGADDQGRPVTLYMKSSSRINGQPI